MNSETTVLRRAAPSDVGLIAAMTRDQIETGLRWTWRPLRVARTLGRADVLGVVAMTGGESAGFCIASYGETRAHIALLGVAPRHRRLGIGARLVEWHVACARVAGTRDVWLELRADNDGARNFYESLGFEVYGRVSHYYQGREDALRMRRVLA